MESPFFRNHWNYYPHSQRPRFVPNMMEVPVQRRTMPVAPKVVSIPVRFVSSEKTWADSATKIQKVFRGFLVRRSVKKVGKIERQVDEIGRRLASEETVELIRNDEKERLKIGETLMSLLFSLDSVKGVDFGIRNFRKAVIKKAIALQEKVDSIVAAADEATDVVDETPEVGNADYGSGAVDRSLENKVSGARETGVEEALELVDRVPEHEDVSSAADIANSESAADENELGNADETASRLRSTEKEGSIIEESATSSSETNVVPEVPADADLLKPQVSDHDMNSPYKIGEKGELAETVDESKVPEAVDDNDIVHPATEAVEEYAAMSEDESQTDSSADPPDSVKGVAECAALDEREGGENEEGHVEEEEEEEEEEEGRIKGREEDKQSRELLERMIVDNKKMMEMMAQLFKRNEMQTQLLCSLSHRVELLEKAFVYETLRRKKKRNSSTIVDGSEKCPKTKNCDKQ